MYTIEITISIVIKNAFLELTTIERMATIEMVVLSNECEKNVRVVGFVGQNKLCYFVLRFFLVIFILETLNLYIYDMYYMHDNILFLL